LAFPEPSRRRRALLSCLCVLCAIAASTLAHAQAPAQTPAPLPAFLQGAYPARATNPEAVARGKALYDAYGCAFCHGLDTRGGNQGPSLLRSQLVQRDQAGETIGPVIQSGVPNTTMVGFALEPAQIADIAEFLHSFGLDSRDPARQRPESIVTGNARAGRRYFEAHCAECHSANEDRRGFAARFADPVELQTNWLMPRNPPPTRVRVTTPNGSVTEGRLARIDEFVVSVALDDGTQRSFERLGNVPQVEIEDPLAAHKALLPMYTDPDIHDVTAYLVTLRE
jgi:mono/diheme cytochrome c family protein